MTKLESILKFVYAKGMENYIKSRRTEADGLKVVNQAISEIKAMNDEAALEAFIHNCIKFEDGHIFFNRKPFNAISDWLQVDCIPGDFLAKSLIRQIHKNMDEVVE